MSKTRRDSQGRTLRKGESVRKYDKMYVYTYTDALGKRRSLYSKDLVSLREKEEQLLEDQINGLDTHEKKKATVNSIFDKYMRTKIELREITYSHYMQVYNCHIRDSFGKKRIAEIKYSDVLNFYLQLYETRQLKMPTIANIQTVLHPVFNLAIRDKIIGTNPADGVVAELRKKTDSRGFRKRHALTLEQQRAFLEYLKGEKYRRWRPLFVVLFGTGYRISEVVGLRWQDVNLKKRTITIDHSITYCSRCDGGMSRYEYTLSLPKTEAGIRTIPMFDEVYQAILEEKEYQKKQGVSCQQKVEGMGGFIFFHPTGRLYDSRTVNDLIAKICESHNVIEADMAERENRKPVIIPKFTCHIMRHTFCTRLCEGDTNLKVIQSVMGHANISTTMDIYTDVTESKKKESFEKLAKETNLF